MSNARQQGAKSWLKDNSQMWKKSNVQIQWLNNKRLFMQVSTILREFIEWPRFHKLLYFLSGGSKWCRECSDEQSLRKRLRPEVSIKSDTVNVASRVTKSLEAPKKGIDLIRKLGRQKSAPYAGKAHKTRICAAEMAVRYAALSACRKLHVCHCNSPGGATWR